jgi:hypothetical protein
VFKAFILFSLFGSEKTLQNVSFFHVPFLGKHQSFKETKSVWEPDFGFKMSGKYFLNRNEARLAPGSL